MSRRNHSSVVYATRPYEGRVTVYWLPSWMAQAVLWFTGTNVIGWGIFGLITLVEKVLNA